ncbi:Nif3-like dinuclear metal center hexameric protein [Thermincola ferriacetica]
MSVKCQTVINYIEQFAPKHLAEEWDNVGVQVGTTTREVSKVLVTLDVTADVVNEALSMGAEMIVSHHPLIFKPLKNLRFDTSFGALIEKIVLNGLVVYSAHTNLDSAVEGVNAVLAEKLGLQNIEILSPDKEEELVKLVVFIPAGHEDAVREAITKAGAGWIGNYSDCTFQVDGIGTFKPLAGSDPFIGAVGQLEKVEEKRLETILPKQNLNRVLKAMLKAHPYEEVAYDVYPLFNRGKVFGLGRMGVLNEETTLGRFADRVKKTLNVQTVKVVGDLAKTVKKVAVCGGSGASLLHKAFFAGADVLVTGDVKHHEALEAKEMDLHLIDAGHNGTEIVILDQLAAFLKERLVKDGVEIYVSQVNTDPFMFL